MRKKNLRWYRVLKPTSQGMFEIAITHSPLNYLKGWVKKGRAARDIVFVPIV